jgi:hypothetical protein
MNNLFNQWKKKKSNHQNSPKLTLFKINYNNSQTSTILKTNRWNTTMLKKFHKNSKTAQLNFILNLFTLKMTTTKRVVQKTRQNQAIIQQMTVFNMWSGLRLHGLMSKFSYKWHPLISCQQCLQIGNKLIQRY